MSNSKQSRKEYFDSNVKNLGQETLALHFGYRADIEQTMSVPIYQNTAYGFDSSTQAGNRFALKELGNIYTRLTNPTTAVLEERLAALEGGSAGIATASGASAIFYAIVNIAQNGDNILMANKIYGGTSTLLVHSLKRFGINTKIFDIDDIPALESLIDSNTKAIFAESISNPNISVADMESISKIAKKHGIISIIDNTVASPALIKPLNHGIDIVVHSISKYISGQGSVLGGAIVERHGLNDFIKGNARYRHFNEPDPTYHGLVYSSLSLPNFTLRVRIALLRDIGATLSPFNSWLAIQGLETLNLRIRQHSINAKKIAEFLSKHKRVKSVSYPGLQSDRYYPLIQKYSKDSLASGLMSFELDGGFEEARKVVDSTNIFSIVVNIGDTKSLIVHPASTTHSQLSKDELESIGITQSMIRLSIGIEDSNDLIADLDSALS